MDAFGRVESMKKAWTNGTLAKSTGISNFRYATFLESMGEGWSASSLQPPASSCVLTAPPLAWADTGQREGSKEGRDLHGLEPNAWDVVTFNREGKMSPEMRTHSH